MKKESESKPEPERLVDANKTAEPQEWEQGLCDACRKDLITPCRATADDKNNCDRICLVRAEIERVHVGYAPLIDAIEMAFKEADFLPDGRLTRQARAVFEPIRKAEQNRRGEGGE